MSTVLSSSTFPTTHIKNVLNGLGNIIVGKDHQIRLALCCLLADGHLLIEDLPGVGKTTLAHALAHILGLNYQRIQFTSDLLPADIIGVSIYSRDDKQFHFHPGPVFSQLILADEINRATPKSQSALLEAMEEEQVTVDGVSHPLPHPFFVIATQNPLHQSGTFPLPESQLDRFLMSISLGYPDPAAERQLLTGTSREHLIQQLQPEIKPEDLYQLQQDVESVFVSEAALDYLQAILAYTRIPGRYQQGLSPRAGLGLLRAAKAWALLSERDHLLPDDIQAVVPAVAGHRLHYRDPGEPQSNLIANLIENIPVN
jgi:MoxR-like ATPase